jgi:hypothetical protein
MNSIILSLMIMPVFIAFSLLAWYVGKQYELSSQRPDAKREKETDNFCKINQDGFRDFSGVTLGI